MKTAAFDTHNCVKRLSGQLLHRSHSCASELSRPGRLRLVLLKPLINLKPLGLAVALAAACLCCAAGTRPASAVQERGDFTLAPHSNRVSGTVFRDTLKDGGQGP